MQHVSTKMCIHGKDGHVSTKMCAFIAAVDVHRHHEKFIAKDLILLPGGMRFFF
jgi:hypothetical protein